MVDRIGHVKIGDVVAMSPSSRAPLYTVQSISDRYVHLVPDDPSGNPRSIPVQAYRTIISVAWDDPRRALREDAF